jgi:hypothetical protein
MSNSEVDKNEEALMKVINEAIDIINKNMPFMRQFLHDVAVVMEGEENTQGVEMYIDAMIEIVKSTDNQEELKSKLIINASNFQQINVSTFIAMMADYSEALRKDAEEKKTKSKIITFPNGLGLNTDTIN